MPRAKSAESRSRTPRRGRVDVATLRRDEIVEAAAEIISETGIQSLSLSEIETRTGMSRGQLTYYFPEKEQILVAVFDRMVTRMRQRALEEGRDQPAESPREVKKRLRSITDMVVGGTPPVEFVVLQYTFLAQMRHRPDFRDRLAGLYEDWRSGLARDFQAVGRRSSPDRRSIACVFQALLHGLVMQSAVDPKAFDTAKMRRSICRIIDSLLAGRGGRP